MLLIANHTPSHGRNGSTVARISAATYQLQGSTQAGPQDSTSSLGSRSEKNLQDTSPKALLKTLQSTLAGVIEILRALPFQESPDEEEVKNKKLYQ